MCFVKSYENITVNYFVRQCFLIPFYAPYLSAIFFFLCIIIALPEKLHTYQIFQTHTVRSEPIYHEIVKFTMRF